MWSEAKRLVYGREDLWTPNIYGIDEICLMSGGGDVIRKSKGEDIGLHICRVIKGMRVFLM